MSTSHVSASDLALQFTASSPIVSAMATPFPGICAIQIQSHAVDGQAIINTVHITDPGLGTAPDLTTLGDLATQFWTWIASTYTALCTTDVTIDQTVAKQVEDPTAPGVILEAAHPIGVAGTRGLGARQGPRSLCGVASFKTPVASRRFRGHNFLPPVMDVASLSGNNLDATGAYWTAAQAYVAKLQAGCAPAVTWTGAQLSAWRLAIYSKRRPARAAEDEDGIPPLSRAGR